MAYVFETVPADRGLIDLDDPREVSWWRKRFDCSESQLRKAVDEVGPSAAHVEQVLDGSDHIVTLQSTPLTSPLASDRDPRR